MDVASLLDLIYATAVDGQSWRRVLLSLSPFVGASSGGLIAPRLRGRPDDYEFADSFDVHILHELDPELSHQTASRVSAGLLVEPFSQPMVDWIGGDFRRVAVARRATDFDDIRVSPYWHEYCLKAEIGDVAAVVLDSPEGRAWPVISLYKPPSAGGFLDDEIARLSWIAPHLQRAARMARRRADLGLEGVDLGAAVDGLSTGCILFNGEGRVLQINPAAQARLALGGLGLKSGLLQAHDQAAERRLHAAILAAAKGVDGGLRVGADIEIAQPGGSVVVSILPLGADNPFRSAGVESAQAVAYLMSTRRATDGAQRAGRLFGLTPAEGEILNDLMAGEAPGHIAQSRGRSLETVRTQIRRILGKAEVESLGELIGLVGRYSQAAR